LIESNFIRSYDMAAKRSLLFATSRHITVRIFA
jgi:hypothetical protein